MTINKYIAALILSLLPTVAFACPKGQLTQDQFLEMAKKSDAVARVLTQSEVEAIEKDHGKPPSVPTDPYNIIRVDHNGWSLTQITTNGCTVNDHVGPILHEQMNKLLGVKEACIPEIGLTDTGTC
jgi:hypothetical protein